MPQDANRRVRQAIVSVMDAHRVSYEDVRRSQHPGIKFTVNGQTRTITYGSGDPRAHMNARTQARRMLAELGVTLHQATVANEEGSLRMEPYDETSRTIETPDENNHADDVQLDQSKLSSSYKSFDPAPPPIEPSEEPVTEPSMPPRYTDAGYVIFTPTKYKTIPQLRLSEGRFFAVKLDRDLLAAKGQYLVIPFDIPDVVWDMAQHEFLSCFAPIQPDPEPEPLAVEVREDRITPAPPPIESSSSSSYQPELEEEEEFGDDDEDISDDETSSSPHFPQSLTVVPPPPRSTESKRAVSPQMGRVILAMYCLHQQGEIEITSHALQSLLSPVDVKQVSGMLGGAIKLRFVARGAALDVGRGTRYKLTAAGRKLAQSLGTWPYDHRGLAVPPWMRELMQVQYATV